MFPISKDELHRTFPGIDPAVINDIWDVYKGHPDKCLNSCCEMAEISPQDATAIILSLRGAAGSSNPHSPVTTSPPKNHHNRHKNIHVTALEAADVNWETVESNTSGEGQGGFIRRHSAPILHPSAAAPTGGHRQRQPSPLQPPPPPAHPLQQRRTSGLGSPLGSGGSGVVSSQPHIRLSPQPQHQPPPLPPPPPKPSSNSPLQPPGPLKQQPNYAAVATSSAAAAGGPPQRPRSRSPCGNRHPAHHQPSPPPPASSGQRISPTPSGASSSAGDAPVSPVDNCETVPKFTMDMAEKVLKYHYDVRTHQWTNSESVVYIDPKPFQEGTMRTAFHLYDLSKPEGSQHYVAKMSKNPKEDTSTYFVDVEMQAFAKLVADEFNKLNPPKKVDFIEASLIKCLERRNQPLLAVEPFLHGKYIKHSNNYGFVSEEDRNTPQAFSHFSYCKSKGEYLICDIQGVQDKYTDPQVHSKDGKGFGKGNMGVDGMAKFFSTHHCNAICRMLLLPPHQPKLVDYGTVGYRQLREGRYQVGPSSLSSTGGAGPNSPLNPNAPARPAANGGAGVMGRPPCGAAAAAGAPAAASGGGSGAKPLQPHQQPPPPPPAPPLAPGGLLNPEFEQQARLYFNQCDKERKGLIDKEGFAVLCNRLGRKVTTKEAAEIIAMMSPTRRERMDFRTFVCWWVSGKRAEAF